MNVSEAIASANIPALIPTLAMLTGDEKWLQAPYAPARQRGLDDNHDGGLPPEIQAEIRAAAATAIADGTVRLPEPSHEQLVRMLSVAMGEPVPPEYGPMIAHELGLGDPPPAPEAVPEGFRAIVVGAGISGLATSIRLAEAGIPHTVLERNATVGGTWLENHYPGAGVDTPSALYSFSFAQQDWSMYFALRDELHGYLERLADDFGVRGRIRFGTEVLGAAYDEDAQQWVVQTDAGETLRANVLITAVGGFNKPKWPALPLADFEGPVVHTARWPAGLDLQGKRVGVIGNGASAMQLVPAVCEAAAHVTVFQRSPQWAAPFDQFHEAVPEGERWLMRNVPLYRAWYRLRSGWTFNDKVHPALQKDPEWEHPDRSVNKVNDGHREFFTRYIESQLGDRPDLIEKVLPRYPPFGKRILLDNGWYAALKRDDVTLITDPVTSLTAGAVNGVELDVLVCATGFDVVRFLAPMEIRGRGGAVLREVWDDEDARAYLGTTVPGFPNLLMVYGPNTQAGHGGSLIGSAEAQLHYILDLLERMLAAGAGAIEVRQDVYEAYNRRVDEAHEQMVWTHPAMETYYRNSRGRVVVTTPFRVVDYWHMTRSADLGDYVVEPAVREEVRS
ncbi:NAD(P)/FAD-dependent oxidoreductase [Solirubrobacter ginsenosidimutans]|uniref:NAD(P)/FAD-dependent oxidoreductase n=1 Tax=Solirubrobacter ginsenosidimutans TaxID=490573 RepID=A0A9X3MUP9_9ACTN|nr:NAD(P)/FAD-dependent oxidoreductase [Solirubrobacter ginsenosidimutans]MDA0162984.1 NAD(P)/FAD-dependent oxidoreductase [Solirubrobacter ginsenosidimutans]